MSSSSPRIGFDRFIHLDWAAAALRVRSGEASADELVALLSQAKLGLKAQRNTRTVLNKVWLQPPPELRLFADRAVELHQTSKQASAAVLSWGMAIAGYSFFGKVSELVGRLSGLQGDCLISEIQRRLMESYGERETTRRAASRVLQTQAQWGFISRAPGSKRITRLAPISIDEGPLTAWLLEAVIRHAGKPVPLGQLHAMPVLFPFAFGQPLGYVASNSEVLSVRSDGPSHQVVGLRSMC